MRATMLLSATSSGVGVNLRLVGYGLSVSRNQGIFNIELSIEPGTKEHMLADSLAQRKAFAIIKADVEKEELRAIRERKANDNSDKDDNMDEKEEEEGSEKEDSSGGEESASDSSDSS